MFCFALLGRGWSGSDSAVNPQYYLRSGSWYRTFSPINFWSNYYIDVIHINADGILYGDYIVEEGGVRIIVSLNYSLLYQK